MPNLARHNLTRCSKINTNLESYAECLEQVWIFGIRKLTFSRNKMHRRRKRQFSLESEQWRLINEEKVQASHQKHHNHEQVSESIIGELSLKIYTVTL